MEPPSFPNKADGPPAEPEIVNPPVAEGINTSDKSPLRTFFINLALTTAGLIVLVIILNYAAVLLAPRIPFSWEKKLIPASVLSESLTSDERSRQRELQRLGSRVAGAMDLPEGMTITVHYSSSPIVNAFATLGGNVMVFQGLLDLMESEDELAMVLAHEIGHVKNRDAVKGLVRAAGLMLLLSGIEDSGAYVQSITTAGTASYSRGQEAAADTEAVQALARLYGHAGGAGAFFRTIAGRIEGRDVTAEKRAALPSIMASHPDTLIRIENVKEAARAREIPADGELTPLPAVFTGR